MVISFVAMLNSFLPPSVAEEESEGVHGVEVGVATYPIPLLSSRAALGGERLHKTKLGSFDEIPVKSVWTKEQESQFPSIVD